MLLFARQLLQVVLRSASLDLDNATYNAIYTTQLHAFKASFPTILERILDSNERATTATRAATRDIVYKAKQREATAASQATNLQTKEATQ